MPTAGEDPLLDAETKVPVLVGISVAFIIASSSVVFLRLYARGLLARTLGLEDLLITFATVLSVGVSATTIIQAQHGLGTHSWLVEMDDTIVQLKALFASIVIYNLAQILTKLSFLMLFYRIFIDKLTRTLCKYMIIFLAIWGVTQEILVGFNCNPLSVFIPSQADHCIDPLTIWYLTSIMNIITDFIVFGIPIPAIIKLQLPNKQKVLVATIFCLGFFTCIISIIRLFTLATAINTEDATWDNVPTTWWSVVELNCGILCASLPTLRPLVRKLTGKPLEAKATYQKQTDPSTDRSRNRATYAMQDLELGGSQEFLKGAAADPRDGADSIDAASQKAGSVERDGGNSTSPSGADLSRALYGKEMAYGPTTAISSAPVDASETSRRLSLTPLPVVPGITVTTETVRQSQRNSEERHGN